MIIIIANEDRDLLADIVRAEMEATRAKITSDASGLVPAVHLTRLANILTQITTGQPTMPVSVGHPITGPAWEPKVDESYSVCVVGSTAPAINFGSGGDTLCQQCGKWVKG